MAGNKIISISTAYNSGESFVDELRSMPRFVITALDDEGNIFLKNFYIGKESPWIQIELDLPQQ